MPKKEIKNDNKKEINYHMTLEGMEKRYEKFMKTREKLENKEIKQKENPQMLDGLNLLYEILEIENKKVLLKLQREFKDYLEYGVDLRKLLRPPYLIPEIVSSKTERALNEI